MTEQDINHFLEGDGIDSEREKTIGQHIGYRYDVNMVPIWSAVRRFFASIWKSWGGVI